jgi:hypothetical protein
MAHLVEAVHHALSRVGELLRRLCECAYPEEIRELMSRYQHEPTFLSNLLAKRRLLYNPDGDTDGTESDIFIFFRTHHLFVLHMLLWVTVTLPLFVPSGMSFSAKMLFDADNRQCFCMSFESRGRIKLLQRN